MKSNIWIFSIEPLDSRYTKQWHQHVPKLLEEHLGDRYNIIQIDGVQKNTEVTPGAFLNFSDTNYWKSSQLCNFLDHYNLKETTPKDQFLFTDFWNPVIIQLKYMNDLLGYDWKFHGLAHAGGYDKNDFLGRVVGPKPWLNHTEQSFFHCYNSIYFATEFHIRMFFDQCVNGGFPSENPWYEEDYDYEIANNKLVRTGWPMEYMGETLKSYRNIPKEDIVLFPHRIAPEKQVEIFRDLAQYLPQYQFIVCQDQQLTKEEYHTLLAKSKIVFSANLQETLGISTCLEGPLAGAVPLAPNRLSYTEIFQDHQEFMYPSKWTEDWDHYVQNRSKLVKLIDCTMKDYNDLTTSVQTYNSNVVKKFFHADGLIQQLTKA